MQNHNKQKMMRFNESKIKKGHIYLRFVDIEIYIPGHTSIFVSFCLCKIDCFQIKCINGKESWWEKNQRKESVMFIFHHKTNRLS